VRLVALRVSRGRPAGLISGRLAPGRPSRFQAGSFDRLVFADVRMKQHRKLSIKTGHLTQAMARQRKPHGIAQGLH
jgi:hypothetical protein